MAANISLPGSGKVLSSRETAAGEQIQQVQLDIGEGDVESPVSASNPLPAELYVDDGYGTKVPVAALHPMSVLVVGLPTYITIRPQGNMAGIVPTLDTNVYADGDVLFNNSVVALSGQGHYAIKNIVVIDRDDQGGAFDIYLFETSATVELGTVNSAPSISDLDAANCIGKVSIAAADYYDLGGVRIAHKDINQVFNSEINLRLCGISRDAKTYTASGLMIKLNCINIG